MNISNFNNSIYFGTRIAGLGYSDKYKEHKNHNGKFPDGFVLDRLESHLQAPGVVMDLGAGQGRNTIPVAQKNYKVFAYEVNPEGREVIKNNAVKTRVSQNIEIIDKNILDDLKMEKKVDFAYMSHISQHFNSMELEQVLKNVAKSIKNGGEFVFDALVRTNEKYKNYDKVPLAFRRFFFDLEDYGAASFWKTDIQKAAQNAGLKIVEEAPFSETFKRARYETQNLWGGYKIIDFLRCIPHKPVKLTWFVLRK